VGLPPRRDHPAAVRTNHPPDRGRHPYLVPEIVLLFKARHSAEPKNQADFAGARPLLDAAAAGWLRWALARVHPGHAWLGALGQAGPV
jgi:hypothetical protein